MVRIFSLLVLLNLIFFTHLYSQDSAILNAVKESELSNHHYSIPNTKIHLNKQTNNIKSKKGMKFFEGWRIGLNYGFTKFKGDITQYNYYPSYHQEPSFSELRSAYSFSFYKELNPYLNLQFEVIKGKFSGLLRSNESFWLQQHDPYSLYEGDGERFENDFLEGDIAFNINMNNLFSSFRQSIIGRRIIFYTKLGVGYNMYHTIKQNLSSENYIYSYGYTDESTLNPDEPKGHFSSPSETVYVIGLNSVFSLSKSINLHLEYTRRKGTTDKWDASIMNTSRFKDDNFDFFSFGISYALGSVIKSEEWKSPIDGLKTNVNKLNADIEGLSFDDDNDGVSDIFDRSPNTPLGVAVDGSGIPLDVDMDNVPDYKDADPFSARNVHVDENGIELDSDSDGVPDSKDLESNTKSGVLVNQFGINMSTYSKNNIISVPTFPSIYFSLGSYNITDSNLSRLTIIALVLANNPDLNLLVIGHTDRIGDKSMNMELGLKRANAVVRKLVDIYQVNEDRIRVKSEGEENPLFNDSQKITIIEGSDLIQDLNKINRRVDFQVID